jgi:hypothetical protein
LSFDQDIEKQRRRAAENHAHDFLAGNQPTWARMDERAVVKILRLWIKENGYQSDFTIWVDPLAESRYWLVPAWALEKWRRDSKNVYEYPLEES